MVGVLTRAPEVIRTPAVALVSVVRVLSSGGFTCVVEILSDGHPAVRVNRPRPEDEVATWAQVSLLLESERPLVVAETWVGVRFEGSAASGSYVGALVARSSGPLSPEEGARIQAMVERALLVRAAQPPARSDAGQPLQAHAGPPLQDAAAAGGTR